MFAGYLLLKIEELQHFALYQGRAIIIVNYYLLLLSSCWKQNFFCPAVALNLARVGTFPLHPQILIKICQIQ